MKPSFFISENVVWEWVPMYTPSKRQTEKLNFIRLNLKKWEVVEFLYPGYLENLLDTAYNAYRWNSLEPEARAETDILQYERQLAEDLKQIPEEKQNEYVSAYHSKFSALLGSLMMCQSDGDGTGQIQLPAQQQGIGCISEKYDEFHEWRNRFKASMDKMKRLPNRKNRNRREAWNRLKRDIASSAMTIHDIDTEKQEDTAVPCSSAAF
nr:hypothetical protein [Phocaeicola plebeius]